MTTLLALVALSALVPLLAGYARHDRFAGPGTTAHHVDDLGPVDERHHLVPRA